MIKNEELITRIATNIFNNCDLGKKTVTQLQDCFINGYELPNVDTLTKVICECVNNAGWNKIT